MNLVNLFNAFQESKISKAQYIKEIGEKINLLSEFSTIIKNHEISEINITANSITMSTIQGINMICNLEDTTAQPLASLIYGDYEKNEIDIVMKIINNGDCVFDIGANYGWYSLNIAKKFPECDIFAFEPIKSIYGFMNKNIELNSFKNIKTFNHGFWHENTTLKFNFCPDYSGGTSIKNIFDRQDTIIIECPVVKLDDFVAQKEFEKIDFIKCDVEGAELFVMRGGMEVVKRFKPVIFAEMLRKWSAKFDYHPNDIISLLAKAEYKCYEINGSKLSLIETVTEETVGTNFFFLNPTKHSDILKRLELE